LSKGGNLFLSAVTLPAFCLGSVKFNF